MLPPLSCIDAAKQIGISPKTLRHWLKQSDLGLFKPLGKKALISYTQTGNNGGGRIFLTQDEVNRLIELHQKQPDTSNSYPSIPAANVVVVGGQTITLGKYGK